MNKKGFFEIIMLMMVLMVTILVLTVIYITAQEMVDCKETFDTFSCWEEDYCRLDCEDLNKELFKYDHSTGGLFGGGGESECWCRDGDETKQIW